MSLIMIMFGGLELIGVRQRFGGSDHSEDATWLYFHGVMLSGQMSYVELETVDSVLESESFVIVFDFCTVPCYPKPTRHPNAKFFIQAHSLSLEPVNTLSQSLK